MRFPREFDWRALLATAPGAEDPVPPAGGLVQAQPTVLSESAPWHSRRRILQLLAGAAVVLAGRSAHAIGQAGKVSVGLLQLPDAEPFPRPGVVETMLFELARNTSVDVLVEAPLVKPSDQKLFQFPLLFLAGTRALPPLSEADRSRLETWLRSGGILFVDDCSGLESSPFDLSVRRELARIFPRDALTRVPESHVLYRTFFLLRRIAGRVAFQGHLEGVTLGEEMTPVLYSRNDLLGAFARDSGGSYLFECLPGGDAQRVAAYKLGINVLMYALCLNYKHDLTHVRALLKKRRGVFDE